MGRARMNTTNTTRSTRSSQSQVRTQEILSQPSQSTRTQRSRNTRRNDTVASSQNTTIDELSPELSTQSNKLTRDEEIQLANSVMRYLLIMSKSKYVILRSNLVKSVFQGRAKHTRQVMATARKMLSKIFGLTMIDTDNGKFILINKLENNHPHLYFPQSERSKQVLLFLVLAHIFMSEESSKEEVLWNFLRSASILNDDDSSHTYFGDVKQLITVEFVKQKYIEIVREEDSDPAKYEYKWGVRAEHELSPRPIMEFISQVYNNRKIETWPAQYKLLMEKERFSEDEEDDDEDEEEEDDDD